MEIHEAALVIPEMLEYEYQNLKISIQENGQRETIKTYQGKILDGRHRERACRELGIEPRYEEVNPNSPMQYVIDLNVERRQLTTGQKAMIALAAEAEFAKEAKKRQGRRDLVMTSSQGRSRDRAAAIVGVGVTAISIAKRLAKDAPDIAEKVRTGRESLNTGFKKLKAREEKQKKELEKKEAAKKQAERDEETQEFLRTKGFRRDDDPVMKSALEEQFQLQLAVDIRRDISALLVDLTRINKNAVNLDTSVLSLADFFGDRLNKLRQYIQDLDDLLSGNKNFDEEIKNLKN